MKQLVAIHKIIRGDEDGKIVSIEPGKPFSADDKEADDLLARGAARLGDGEEAATDDKDDVVSLDDMTKAQLVEHAKDHGIEVDDKATKAVILAAIQAASAKDDGLI